MDWSEVERSSVSIFDLELIMRELIVRTVVQNLWLGGWFVASVKVTAMVATPPSMII